MGNETPEETLNRIATTTVCAPEQVREVVRLALEALHRRAACDETNVTAALEGCYFTFGEGACYHLGGILEEARTGTDPELPWSEFFSRFSPGTWDQFQPIFDEWMKNRNDARKGHDETK